jgi:hypothetical protein
MANGHFTCISGPDGCPATSGDTTLDVTGLWVTPGLIDSHVHLAYEFQPESTARAQTLRLGLGITTVRDAGGLQVDSLLAARERAEDGSYPSPRIVVAARPAASYAERFGVALGAPLVERLAELGVDQIKIKDNLWSDSTMVEEIRAAVRLGLPAFGHTWRGPPPEVLTSLAMRAGLSGVSHLGAVAPTAQVSPETTRSGPPEEDPGFVAWRQGLWLTADPQKLLATADEMIGYGVWLEPLLVTEFYMGTTPRPPPRLRFLRIAPPSLRELIGGRDPLAEPARAAFEEPYALMARFVRDFHERGGLVVAGSDHVRPGLDLHAEIRLLREAGLSPLESLRAATVNAARALGRADLGSIEIGKTADAVVHDADPLADPGNTTSARYVVKGGHLYSAADLLAPERSRYAERVREAWIARAFRGARALLVVAAFLGLVFVLRRARTRRGAVRD